MIIFPKNDQKQAERAELRQERDTNKIVFPEDEPKIIQGDA